MENEKLNATIFEVEGDYYRAMSENEDYVTPWLESELPVKVGDKVIINFGMILSSFMPVIGITSVDLVKEGESHD